MLRRSLLFIEIMHSSSISSVRSGLFILQVAPNGALFTNNLFFLRTACPYGTFGFIKKGIAKSLNHFLLKSNVFKTLKINSILI